MNLDHLPYLIAIASTGTLSGAARQLHISQPTLSNYLKKLEGELGVELFFRGQKKYLPTPAGRLYIQTAHSILEHVHHARSAIRSLEGGQDQQLRLGLSPNWGVSTLADIYPDLENRFPQVNLLVKEGFGNDLRAWLEAGELDAIITSFWGETPPGARSLPLLRESMVLAVPAFHPLAPRGAYDFSNLPTADLRDFSDSVFIMPSPTSTLYGLIQKYFEDSDFQPQVTTTTPNIKLQEALIRSGARVGLLPGYCVRPDPALAFLRLKNGPVMQVAYLTASSRFPTPAERYLLYLIVKHELHSSCNSVVWGDALREILWEFDPIEATNQRLEVPHEH